MTEPGPQIQIDDDWKAQAQREKQAAAEKAKAAAPSPSTPPSAATETAGSGSAGRSPRRELPEASFSTLVNQLASQALLYLGVSPDPRGQQYVSPEMARHQIDLLAVLEDKTDGQLSEEEASVIAATLYELREAYLNVSRMLRDQALGRDMQTAGR
ncbi:MAG: DUF1844 domain-containing protein [Planctomycetota bacterium]